MNSEVVIGAAGPSAQFARLVAQAMASSVVFRSLSEGARARLAGQGGSQLVARDAMLCRAGEPGESVYVVLEGEIEVRLSSADGRDVRIVSLTAGDLLGEMAALDGGPRSADMVALRTTRLWRIPREALLAALESEPKAALALIAELSRRIRGTNEALEASALLDLGGRVARLLLQERNARDLVAMTQTEMARRLGASREKVNRKLHEFADQGWVRILPSGLHLLHVQRLEALAINARRR
jgi:CRP-like cAMP-binding protein